jgi:hypothetical protein
LKNFNNFMKINLQQKNVSTKKCNYEEKAKANNWCSKKN